VNKTLNSIIITNLLIGINRYAYQVLPSYDLIRSKMQDQLIAFEFDTVDQTNAADLAENQLELNITNAIEKLDKY
jgi:hypothetical protein